MPKKLLEDDSEPFINSEDDYESDVSTQSGGDSDDNDPIDDNEHLDLDSDDEEKGFDSEGDEEYDPVNDETLVDDDAPKSDNEDDNEDNDDGNDDDNNNDNDNDVEVDVDDNDDDNQGNQNSSKICHATNLNKEFITLDEDDSNMYAKMDYVKIKDSDRITDPQMTYYEMVRILGVRSAQINYGSLPLVKGVDHLSSTQKAYIELISKMTPIRIRRPLPGKKYEDWGVNELELYHTVDDKLFVPPNFNISDYLKSNNIKQ